MFMYSELDRMRKCLWFILRYYPSIFLKQSWKTTENVSQ